MDSDGLGNACDPYPANADNLGMCLSQVSEKESLISSLISENARLREELAGFCHTDKRVSHPKCREKGRK
jgi:hypothetical protein